MAEEKAPDAGKSFITSQELSVAAVWSCRAAALVLGGAGITATFVAGTGAAPAAMILFGSLFLILALMRRIPLSLEVGGAKFDASYEAAAFDAGREAGMQRGVQVALNTVEKAEESGESPHLALERLSEVQTADIRASILRALQEAPLGRRGPDGDRYRGHVACSAAGITYRQLDYWVRTGLVEPTRRRTDGPALYSERDIVILTMIKRLLDAGISLQQIRTAVAHLRERPMEDLEKVTLMSDGESVYEATSDEEVIDLLQGGVGIFGIALGGLVREIRSTLKGLPADGDDSSLG